MFDFRNGFAETYVSYEGSQDNVVEVPESVSQNGLIPTTSDRLGQSLPANWLNFLFRTIFRLFNRDKTTDETGMTLFTTQGAFIELFAIDRADPTKYIHAMGYKPVNGTHVLQVISSNTLTLGTAVIDGTQPVNGGTDVIVLGKSREL